MAWSDEEKSRAKDVYNGSKGMSNSDLYRAGRDSALRGDRAAAAGYMKRIANDNNISISDYNNYKKNSGGSCFITTAVCDSFGKADDCYELTAFRNFRDKWLVNQSDGKSLIDEYYNIAPKIVKKINSLSDSAEIYKNIWRDYLSNCLKFIESGDDQQCKKVYISMVNTLKEKFLA